ncbi:MAG: N-acetyltransferase [Bryobacteraceae bacterium]|nr:N-acetyltransferase [Bryobacteraceae bacterium]
MTVRKARMSDLPAMLTLINDFARQGIMLPRNEFELSESIRDFSVVERDGEVIGCAALHFYGPSYAEVRSLAVSPKAQGSGAGRLLMEALEREAREFDLDILFAFTYVPGFFAKTGYREIDRGLLPLKAWKDCLRCPKFTACDEIAVVRELKPGVALPAASIAVERDLVQLPVIRSN